MLVSAFTNRFFLMVTSRHDPVSNHPLQSPQSRMPVPDVWSNRLFSTITLRGVENKAPRARLFLTILSANVTCGVHVRFSMPKVPRSGPTESGNTCRSLITNSFAPGNESERYGAIDSTIFRLSAISMVCAERICTVSPGSPHRNPYVCGCIYLATTVTESTFCSIFRYVPCTLMASSIIPSYNPSVELIRPLHPEKWVASA